MTISKAQANARYQEARDALSAVVQSPKATRSEKDLARRKRDVLDAEFIGRALDDLEGRTEQFEAFVQEMDAVTERLENNSLVRAVKKAREVTEKAKDLLVNGA